jgi:drug/metabolite transporter (DMT)-like permease
MTALFIRMLFGAVSITTLAAMLMAARRTRAAAQTIEISPEQEHLPPGAQIGLGAALGLVLVGVVFGPISGVWLSLVSVKMTDVGIATTLTSLSPVFILPFAWAIEKERITLRGCLGAIVAVGGVAMLVAS